MSFLSDTLNRIRGLLSRNKQLNSAQRDLILESNLEKNAMDFFNVPQNYNAYCQRFFSQEKNFLAQYDYVDLISQMQKNGAMEEYTNYLNYVESNENLYYPSQVHGVDHTKRVLFFAEMLSMLDNLSNHDRNLVMVAAQLHDIGRENDARAIDHGKASKEKIEYYGLLRNFSERDQKIIKFVVESHSLEPEQVEMALKNIPRRDRKDFKRILDYLQDADKLDRTRIAQPDRQLDPERLATPTAKRLVKVAHQNFWEFDEVLNYEKQRMTKDAFGINLEDTFKEIRKRVNISFKDFQNILSEYQTNTLEKLKAEGRLFDLFNLDTFLKYRKPESFEEYLKPNRVDKENLFLRLNKDKETLLNRETFNRNFMLYYNLQKNNPEAFEFLCYVDLDINHESIVGIANEVRYTDLERFYARANYFTMNDLFLLGSNLTPEEYRSIMDSNDIQDLYSTKFEKNSENIRGLKASLSNKGIVFDENTFNQNYRLIETIDRILPDIFTPEVLNKYSIPEIFSVVTKLDYANHRVTDGKTHSFRFDTKTAIDLLEDTRGYISGNSEKDQLNYVENFAKENFLKRDARYTQYVNKRNKPYIVEKPEDILNYKEYCADKILEDMNISLEDAKSKLVNALFRLDIPPEYRLQLEKETMDRMYYFKKYLPYSSLNQNCAKLIDTLDNLFEATNIKDFKNMLYENKSYINIFNTEEIELAMEKEIGEFAKDNMTYELQNTARAINEKDYETVYSSSGRPISAKVLNGENFYIATSTSMPRCSSVSTKIINEHLEEAKSIIYNKMLSQPAYPNNVCTSIQSNEMLAHAGSALQDQELIFGYVPNYDDSISLSAKYDLSTVNRNGVRTTNKVTTYRNIYDLTSETTEEHNETVMNGVYPSYIICYDAVSDIAIDKKQALEEQYRREGINQKVDIVLIKAKESYLPSIKDKVLQEHNAIHQKLADGSLTYKDFALMFERKESNFVLRSLQAIHSGSYRDDVWDENFNRVILESTSDILEKVSSIVPPEKSRAVLDQVDTLLSRADNTKDGYGRNFYDHTYASNIDTIKLNEIRRNLYPKVVAYEKWNQDVGENPNINSKVDSDISR